MKLKRIASANINIEYYDVTDYVYQKGLCSAYDKNGKLMYFDSSHLSLPAFWKLGREIVYKENGTPFPFPFPLIPDWIDFVKAKSELGYTLTRTEE
jgi:hypothetical protein